MDTVCCPDEKGQIDLKKLMTYLGNEGIDSILLEGGGTLNDSALRAGIVKEVHCFIAPKLFGGKNSKTPVQRNRHRTSNQKPLKLKWYGYLPDR